MSRSDESDDFLGDDDVKENRGFVTEFMRKLAVGGLGALFMTEEGIRSLAGQLKLPKEALGFLLAQAEKTKDDISRTITEELRRFFQSEKLRDEFLKVLAGMTVEVTAQVRLVPTSERKGEPPAASPEVTVTQITARRGKKKKE